MIPRPDRLSRAWALQVPVYVPIGAISMWLMFAAAAAAATAATVVVAPPGPVVLLTGYGAVPGAESNNAAAIGRATARCVALSGCTLLSPRAPGSALSVYRTSSFVVPSHTTVWVPVGVQPRSTESDAVNPDNTNQTPVLSSSSGAMCKASWLQSRRQ